MPASELGFGPAVVHETVEPSRRGRSVAFARVSVCAALAFLALALVAHHVPYFAIDVTITRYVQSMHASWLKPPLDALNALGFPPLVTIVYAAIILLILAMGARWEAVATGFAALGASGLNHVVKAIVARPRPPADLVHVAHHLPGSGFPAGHVLNFTAFAGFLCYLVYARIRPSWARSSLLAVLLAMIALMGVARIYAGEHWPSDVLGGYLLGFVWLGVTIEFYRWRTRRSRERGVPAGRAVLLAAIGVTMFVGAGCAPSAQTPPVDLAGPLRSLVHSAHETGLRWPDFADVRSELERLYQRAGWRALWLRGTRPTEAATELIARLKGADSLGLEPADYDAEWLHRRARIMETPGGDSSPDELARFDVGLSVAAVRFVSALHRGRVSPRVVHAQLFIPRRSLAVEMAVDSLRDAGQQGAILEGLQPGLLHYQLLKNGLARFRALARDSSLVPLPALPAIVRPGMRILAAPRLRHLLEATGDLDRPAVPGAAASTLYSADLVAAVKRFQIRQGFKPDGVIGTATVERLNRPFAQRVRQIELALERFRWLPDSFSAPPIIVNIPAFRLYAFRGASDREEDMLTMDVVVGDAFDTQTPVFAADMRYLIFRPYWEVPASIMTDELGPKAIKDPGLLEREQMVVVGGESDRATILPASRENRERIGKDLRVRQLPGLRNALGLVKFVMPNAFDVYLHDTPAKGVFAQARRDFSHGCIRLSDPVALAAHVLRDQPEWTVEHIKTAMNGEDNTRVDLSGPIPVCIVYATAIARENGEVYFYPDIYHLDEELDQLLENGYPYPK